MEIVYLQVVTLLDLPLNDMPLFPFNFIYFYSYNYAIISAAAGILLGQLGSTCPSANQYKVAFFLYGRVLLWFEEDINNVLNPAQSQEHH